MESSLTSVALVCRSHDAIAALDHVATTISGYLDTSNLYDIVQAAAKGYLTLIHRIKFASESQQSQQIERAIEAATEHGHLAVVQWLFAQFPNQPSTWAMEIAACHGHLMILKWLHENTTTNRLSFTAMDVAAEKGWIEIVQWLHDHYPSIGCTTRAMDGAAGNGHLEIVEWLHVNRTEGCTTQAMDWAAKNGHLAVVQWLHAHRTEGYSMMSIQIALARGHLDVVQWLETNQVRVYSWSGSKTDSDRSRSGMDCTKDIALRAQIVEPVMV